MSGLALSKELSKAVDQWRKDGYPCEDYSYIGHILSFQVNRWQETVEEGDGGERQREILDLKYLREPQFLALETYWYVRLILKTPRVVDLYKRFFGDDKEGFFQAVGISLPQDTLDYVEIDKIMERVKSDEDFVARKKLDALSEAIQLDYPSYILALAMGAGKTVLIGTIVATEFAMSLHYPDSEIKFMRNALVFAPGKTIIESLRELSDLPYSKILPPDVGREFLANLKIEYPNGKEKSIQVQAGSFYNLIVTNTEKISLRAKRRGNQTDMAFEHSEVQANLRLQKITSLPDLGIFSDEAHHTYGNTFDKLKRVRETINYINEQGAPLVAVVNTTGTPYYKRKPLAEVIVWYGLREGIRDNILKSLKNGIHEYSLRESPEEDVFNDIIREFFTAYGDVSLPNGAKAKIAFYFKTQEHLDESRAMIEKAMAGMGQDISQILVNTQRSDEWQIRDFNRLNHPDSLMRVILLIGKGVEGWNCPSLFACALIKDQTSSNYVLQASTRCLRQVPGNTKTAKIFLDSNNSSILSKQLRENFSTEIVDLQVGDCTKKEIALRIRKTRLPELEITRIVPRAIRKEGTGSAVVLQKPRAKAPPSILRSILTIAPEQSFSIMTPTGKANELTVAKRQTSCHAVAQRIASRYHLSLMPILRNLKEIYPKGMVPNNHVYGLLAQAEKGIDNYETIEEKVTEVMALIRVQDEHGEELFEKHPGADGDEVYVHRLRMRQQVYEQQADLFLEMSEVEDKHDLSYHYEPYNFDSRPERSFFNQILSALNADPREVEAFLFTGGLTNAKMTDFHFEYMDPDGQYHRYFPDFVVVKKKTREFYIVEVKG